MKKQIFSRLLSLVLTAVMLVGVLPIAVWAETSEFSYYTAANAEGEYAVIDGYRGDGGNVVVPAEIDGLPVKQIAYGVFSNNYTLTHVTVSEGIEVISGQVFSFSSVKTISLPSTLKTISAQCFIGSELRELTIPEGVTMIGDGVFADCFELENVYLEAKAPCEEWDERWAEYCYADIWYDGELVSVCKEEGDFLFRIEGENATVLDYRGDMWADCLVVPETIGDAAVTVIGAHAFQDQYYLEEIVLPDTVTEIQYDAFVSCGYLTKLDLPLGLTEIGSHAFKWCKNLQELRIPETVTYIGENAFMAVYATLYFEAPEASADWHENWAYEFYGPAEWSACVHRDVTVDKVDKTCESDGYCHIVCNGCGAEISYEVLEGGHEYVYGVCGLCGDVKDVSGDYSYFDGGDGIWIEQYYGSESQVAIPSELDGRPVVAISTYAFAYNSTVTDVVIPDTVRVIGGSAFSYTSLTEIHIPASVTEIGLGAFEHSDKLENIYFESSERPEGLDDNWIRGCDADVYYDGVWGAGVTGDYYIELKNGGVRIMRFDGYAPTGVFEIPAEFEGLPVTEIAENAFSSKGDMTGLIIPDTVELIDSWAFSWNGSLVEATIPASVTTIYSEIFSGCEAMENIYCEVAEQPEGWNSNWASNCAASIWFEGVMKVGTIDGFRVERVDGGFSIVEYIGDETEVVIPAEMDGVPVVKIAQQAFWCNDVTSVTIPDTVTFIGYEAFGYTNLTEITIPASVEVVEQGVFWDCDELQNVYCEAESQPETWDDGWLNACSANLWFDGRFFRGVEGDYLIEVADGGAVIIEYLGSEAEIVVPSELAGYPVTAIAENAFEYYETATSIVLPETVATIGNRAFYFCTSLVSITLPEGLTYIGERAFEECFDLAEVAIPDGVKYIGGYAFGWCYDLTEITIPASVETMGDYVFEECQSLTDIYCEAASQPEGWSENWSVYCDANLWFGGVLVRGWSDGYQITIADGRVTILGYAGEDTEIVIPYEISGCPVFAIGSEAFADTHTVTSITIPNSVVVIGDFAFAWCSGLTEITIPASVQVMGGSVLWECSALQNIYCESESKPVEWKYNWADGCNANIWFGGQLAQGVIDGFVFDTENDVITIIDYVGSASELVIPAEINGVPVKSIESQAFASLDGVTSVVISEGIENIYYEAFAYNDSLLTVTIPASVTYMNNDVFWSCDQLQNIYCAAESQPERWESGWTNGCDASIYFDGVLTQGIIDGFKIMTYEGQAAILGYLGSETEITIPAELGGMPVVGIEGNAFSGMNELTSVVIPDSVTLIGSYAFSYCYSLTEITIPASVEFMHNNVFWECGALQNIYCEISEQPDAWNRGWANGCDASIWFDGVLVRGVIDDYSVSTENGEVTILRYLGDSKDIVIPAELGGLPVTKIGVSAFSDFNEIESLIIPESIREIGGYAFSGCSALTTVVIPDSVLYMAEGIFLGCDAMQVINCEAAKRPEGWSNAWTSGCNAEIYFDGVLAQGVVDDYMVRTENGEVTILGYVGDATEPVIPSELGGMPVKHIGYRAFYGNERITGVRIPDGVVSIGYEAFAFCNGLTEITIPASVTTMDNDVFWYAQNLQNVYCEAESRPEGWYDGWTNGCEANVYFGGVLKIGVIDGFRIENTNGEITILGYVGDAAEVVIPAEIAGTPVTCIESCAFSSRVDIKSVVIPDSVVTIGYEAFAYCEGLTEITIPDSVEYMGEGVFYGSLNLKNIYCEAVSEPGDWSEVWLQGCDADVYFDGVMKVGVVDGFRVSFDGDHIAILGYCGESSDVVIPSELNGLPVTRIERSAFSNENWITSVSIPDGIVSIGEYAFAWCSGLTEITIPASVAEMGYDVFYESKNIQNIYCEISRSMCEWDESWMNGCDANIYFDGVMIYGTIDGFTFKVEDRGASIIGYVGDATALVIPAELAGTPVTRIEERAFNHGTFESVTIPDSVTYIGYRAFAYCDYLTEVTIPASVTKMGGFIFRNSYNLQNIYCEAAKMPSGWQSDWANGCNANIYFDGVMMQGVIGEYRVQTVDGEVTIIGYLGDAAEVVIPAEIGGFPVTSIGQDAFDGCDWITSVVIPDSVTHIGYEAFAYCGHLTEITIPASVTEMDGDVFWYCEGLKVIYCEASAMPEGWSGTWLNGCYANVYFDGALYAGVFDGFCFVLEDGGVTIRECLNNQEEIVVPAVIADCNVIRIGEYAFAGRSELKRVVLPETLKCIGAYAFDESSLEEIVLPDGLEMIEERAFQWCGLLTEITIPASVTFVGERAFGSCDTMQNIYCESGKYVGDWAYNWANGTNANVYVEGALVQGEIDGLKIRTENGYIVIEGYVGSAERVVIPAEIGGVPVTEIGGYAFAECEWITRVTIPDSVTVIGAEAFAWCTGLTEMIIPASVTGMGYDVFWGCDSLDSIYCDAVECPAGWNGGWEDGCYADIYFDRTLRQGVDNEYLLSYHDGMVTILAYLGESSTLIIPEMIGGRTVAAVDSMAFANCLSLTKVTIPAYVTQMGDGIFNNCKNLENIYCEAEERPEGWSEIWAYGCDANIYFNGTMVQGVAGDYHIRVDEDGVAILSYLKDEEHVVIPAELLGMPVSTIEHNAFGWHSMTGVTIPETVMYIGYEAFAYCENLTEITIPASVVYMDNSVFWGCNHLQKINCEAGEQPEDWEYSWADGCYADIYFGGKLTIGRVGDFRVEIGEDGVVILAYYGTSKNVVVPAEIEGAPVVEIAFDAFLGADFSGIVLPDSLRVIGPYAFEGCYNLTEITIPASVEYIDAYAFGNCEKLKTIRLAENAPIERWENPWYVDCYADIWKGDKKITLTEGDYDVLLLDGGALILRYAGNDSVLTIPATIGGVPVIAIGAGAFSGKNMTSAVLPDTIKSIGNAAFAECLGMKTIVLPKSLQEISYHAFASCISLAEITIPGSVERIEDEAFLYCENLKKVVLQEGVLAIGSAAFAVSGLQSIVLPSTLKLIDNYAFAETKLTEITIPRSVEKIGGLVFDGTTSLRVINCEAKSAQSGWNAYWKNGCEAQVVWGTASDSDCLYGDVNGDGKINGTDVTRLLRYIANRNPLTGESTVEIGDGADCNGDGKITGTDVTRLLRYIANRNPLTGESSVTLGPSK